MFLFIFKVYRVDIVFGIDFNESILLFDSSPYRFNLCLEHQTSRSQHLYSSFRYDFISLRNTCNLAISDCLQHITLESITPETMICIVIIEALKDALTSAIIFIITTNGSQKSHGVIFFMPGFIVEYYTGLSF